ncbi:MAG: hypothetical protein AB7I19_05520 [Planctomycetota bacterium]
MNLEPVYLLGPEPKPATDRESVSRRQLFAWCAASVGLGLSVGWGIGGRSDAAATDTPESAKESEALAWALGIQRASDEDLYANALLFLHVIGSTRDERLLPGLERLVGLVLVRDDSATRQFCAFLADLIDDWHAASNLRPSLADLRRRAR